MASIEETCEGNANFAIICSFITKFGADCGVQVTISALKEMLEDTKNVPEELKDILIHLLRKGKKRVTKEKWERALVKFCHEYSSVDAWEIERFGYKKAKLSVKLELLKRLLELQFDHNAKFKTEVNKHDATTLRVLPIGKDIDGHSYWYQIDKDCNMRLYMQEAENEESWRLLCSTKDELQEVIETLGKKTNVKKDITKVLKNESILTENEQVPTNTEENMKQESKENVLGELGEHEDLKASLSPTNPCAIIIKTEKKEITSSLVSDKTFVESQKNTEVCNQSVESASSVSISEVAVINDRKVDTKTVNVVEECLPKIKICPESQRESNERIASNLSPETKMEVEDISSHIVLSKSNDNLTSSTKSSSEPSLNIVSTLLLKPQEKKSDVKTIPADECSMETTKVKQTFETSRSIINSAVNNSKLLDQTPEKLETNKDCNISIKINKSILSQPILKCESPEVGKMEFKGSKMKLYEKWSNERKKKAISNQTVVSDKKSLLMESRPESLSKVSSPSDIQMEPLDLALDVKSVVQHKSVISPNCSSVISKTSASNMDIPQDLSRPVICYTNSTNTDQSLQKGIKDKSKHISNIDLHLDRKLKRSSEKLSPVDNIDSLPFKKKAFLLDTNQNSEFVEPSRHSVIFAVKNSKLVSPKFEELHVDHAVPSPLISSEKAAKPTLEAAKTEPSAIILSRSSEVSVTSSKEQEDLSSKKLKCSSATDYSTAKMIGSGKPDILPEHSSISKSHSKINTLKTEHTSVHESDQKELDLSISKFNVDSCMQHSKAKDPKDVIDSSVPSDDKNFIDVTSSKLSNSESSKDNNCNVKVTDSNSSLSVLPEVTKCDVSEEKITVTKSSKEKHCVKNESADTSSSAHLNVKNIRENICTKTSKAEILKGTSDCEISEHSSSIADLTVIKKPLESLPKFDKKADACDEHLNTANETKNSLIVCELKSSNNKSVNIDNKLNLKEMDKHLVQSSERTNVTVNSVKNEVSDSGEVTNILTDHKPQTVKEVILKKQNQLRTDEIKPLINTTSSKLDLELSKSPKHESNKIKDIAGEMSFISETKSDDQRDESVDRELKSDCNKKREPNIIKSEDIKVEAFIAEDRSMELSTISKEIKLDRGDTKPNNKESKCDNAESDEVQKVTTNCQNKNLKADISTSETDAVANENKHSLENISISEINTASKHLKTDILTSGTDISVPEIDKVDCKNKDSKIVPASVRDNINNENKDLKIDVSISEIDSVTNGNKNLKADISNENKVLKTDISTSETSVIVSENKILKTDISTFEADVIVTDNEVLKTDISTSEADVIVTENKILKTDISTPVTDVIASRIKNLKSDSSISETHIITHESRGLKTDVPLPKTDIAVNNNKDLKPEISLSETDIIAAENKDLKTNISVPKINNVPSESEKSESKENIIPVVPESATSALNIETKTETTTSQLNIETKTKTETNQLNIEIKAETTAVNESVSVLKEEFCPTISEVTASNSNKNRTEIENKIPTKLISKNTKIAISSDIKFSKKKCEIESSLESDNVVSSVVVNENKCDLTSSTVPDMESKSPKLNKPLESMNDVPEQLKESLDDIKKPPSPKKNETLNKKSNDKKPIELSSHEDFESNINLSDDSKPVSQTTLKFENNDVSEIKHCIQESSINCKKSNETIVDSCEESKTTKKSSKALDNKAPLLSEIPEVPCNKDSKELAINKVESRTENAVSCAQSPKTIKMEDVNIQEKIVDETKPPQLDEPIIAESEIKSDETKISLEPVLDSEIKPDKSNILPKLKPVKANNRTRKNRTHWSKVKRKRPVKGKSVTDLSNNETSDNKTHKNEDSNVTKEATEQEMSDNPPDLMPSIAFVENKLKSYKESSEKIKIDLKDNSESSDISNDIPILDKQVTDDIKVSASGKNLIAPLPDLISDVIASTSKSSCDKDESKSQDDAESEQVETRQTRKSTRAARMASMFCEKKEVKSSKSGECIVVDDDPVEIVAEISSAKKTSPKKSSSKTGITKPSPATAKSPATPTKIATTSLKTPKSKGGKKARTSRLKTSSPDIKPASTESTLLEPAESQSKITSFKMDFFDDPLETLDFKNFPLNALRNLELHKKILSKSVPVRMKYGGTKPEEMEEILYKRYTSYMHHHCYETKYRDYTMACDGNNFTFKVKQHQLLGLELPVLKSGFSLSSPVAPLKDNTEVSFRQTRARERATKNTEIKQTPRKKPTRSPRGKTSTPKSASKIEQTPDFIPEGFLEILGNSKAKRGSEKDSSSAPARNRQNRAQNGTIVHSSESESTSQSSPIKRSRRIQAQHEKKMSELAVEMQREQRRLEQLAKKNAQTPNKKPNTQQIKTKANKTITKTPKFQPPEMEDAGLDSNRPKRKRKTVMNMAKLALMYDDDSKESEQSTSRSTEKSRRKRAARGSKKRSAKPWDVSSESSSSLEDVTEEEEEEIEEPLVFTISDDEFACEEIIEDEEPVVVRRARTAKKVDEGNNGEETVSDDKPCGKCGKHDRPEWILLCDNCDDGYHTNCLVPQLFTIPDGDWYCQPCEHLLLCECLSKELQNLEQLLKQREREELRKQRLAYVGISLDNVLKPEKEKKESESSTDENDVEVEDEKKPLKSSFVYKTSSEDEIKKTIFSKRSSRRRQKVNYQFKEYDELIASAIQDDMFDIKMAEEFVPPEKDDRTDDEDEEDDDEFYAGPASKKRSRRTLRPRRKLNDLDFSCEDDSGDDYKGLSTDTEHTPSVNTEVSNSGSNASGEWRIVKTKPKVKSRRKKRRGKYTSSEDDDDAYGSDESNYRPSTRRAAQKTVSYRELSSEDEWEEYPKKPQKRKKKDSTSDTSETSVQSPQAKRKPKPTRKWDQSTSEASESGSTESEESSSTRQSEGEWKIEKKSSEGGRIKININKRQIESDSNSSAKESKVKKKVNRIVSDDSDEDDDDGKEEDSEDEETDEDDEDSSGSSDEDDEDDKDSKKSETLISPRKIPISKAKIPTVHVKTVPKLPENITKPVIEGKSSAISEIAPNNTKTPTTTTQVPTPAEKTPPVTSQVRVAKVPNVVGLPKNVVCRAVALGNREQVSSSQIVVKTVVVKTVPKGAIKEIKMVPSKIPYKDKIDSNEVDNKKSTPSPKEVSKSPMSNSPTPNSPGMKSVLSAKPPTPKVIAVNLQSSPKHISHKTTSVISNAPPIGKPFLNPTLEQQRYSSAQQMLPKNIPPHQFSPGMPDVVRGHPMQNIGSNGQPTSQRFPNSMMEQRPRHPLQMGISVRNTGSLPQRFSSAMINENQMRSRPPMSNNNPPVHPQMASNRAPRPPMSVVGPSSRNYSGPAVENKGSTILQQQLSQQSIPLKNTPATPPQQPYSGSIVEPFSTADIDQSSDSRDEVPLERIPSASNSPPVELLPNKPSSYDKDSEYRPAKDANYPYTIPEEKNFPSSYSPLSSLQEFTSRPSPLKPSLVETYPSNSASPTRLTSLDNYSQASSPKGFISLETFPQSRKKAIYTSSPSRESGINRPVHTGEHFQGEARFSQEPYPCQSSPGSFQQRTSSPQQREMGTPPRFHSQFPDSYAPPRSPEFYQNQQQQSQYYSMDEGMPRAGYQPNYTPSSDNSSYSYMPNAMQQPNDGFMIDTILRARNEDDELGNVSGIVQYITQQ